MRGLGRACVAGVQTPAFVEHCPQGVWASYCHMVSPEFRLRPSLSVPNHQWDGMGEERVLPEFRLRPSLSVPPHPAACLTPRRVSPEFRLRPSLSVPPRADMRRVGRGVPTLTAARLFDMVNVRGYTGGPDHFRHRIAQLRPHRPREAYLRLRTLPGEQA